MYGSFTDFFYAEVPKSVTSSYKNIVYEPRVQEQAGYHHLIEQSSSK